MFAVLALVAFLVGFVLHVAGGAEKYVVDAVILGLACLAAHFIWNVVPWRRP